MKRKRFAIFISGTGSNFNAALDMRDFVDIALLVSSRKKAPGILKAKRAGVPVFITSNPVDWEQLSKTLSDYNIDFIFLLGFMKLLPESFVELWKSKILNIHPSLLPEYPGLESIQKSFEAKSAMGATVHEVVAEMDAGPIVLQRKIGSSKAFHIHNNLEETEFNIHLGEHRLVREVLAKWNRAVTL